MFRFRVALLTLLGAFAGPAVAQTPPSPPPAPPEAAATPAAPAAAPQAEAPQPPAPAVSPQPGSNASDAAQIVSVLDRFCVPAVAGAPAAKLAASVGIRTNRDGDMVLALAGGNRITVSPPDTSNPNVCILTVLYDVGGDRPIFDALKGWALAHKPAYAPGKVRESSTVGDESHIISTWEGTEADGIEGLVFVQARTADDKPLTAGADQATIIFSVQPK
jgi:hypothetical protein